MKTRFEAFLELIEFAATAETIDHLETLQDLVTTALTSPETQAEAAELIIRKITQHPAY